jgi:hypothetical protein
MTGETFGLIAFLVGSLSFLAMCAWVLYDFRDDTSHRKHPRKIKKA